MTRPTLDALLAFAASAALSLLAALTLGGCSSRRIEAAPERSSRAPAPASPSPSASASASPSAPGSPSASASADRSMPSSASAAPSLAVSPIAADRLCVTKGAAALGSRVTEPTLRGVALGSSGDAASLSFVFRGDTATSRELASGESRRQLGLKLRAQDGCNLLYVMWRLDPKPSLSVSLKHNPGKRTHQECGASGYTRLKPARSPSTPLAPVPSLVPGASHTLRAELSSGELLAWIDDALVWRGPLPPTALSLSGPAGLRSDNVSFDLIAFATAPAASAASGSPAASAKCSADASD